MSRSLSLGGETDDVAAAGGWRLVCLGSFITVLPPRYTQACMSGLALSGVGLSVICEPSCRAHMDTSI